MHNKLRSLKRKANVMKHSLIITSALFLLAACGSATTSQVAQSPDRIDRDPVSIGFGSYVLFETSEVEISDTNCLFTLDMDIINGPTGAALRLGNDIHGVCTVALNRDAREYQLNSVENIGCGSKRYHGTLVSEDKVATVILTDHRQRLCMDMVPNQMTLTESKDDSVKTWYTASLRQSPIDPDRFTCMAYWTGFQIDTNTNSCVARGTSGCSNPFRFLTEDACASFFRLN